MPAPRDHARRDLSAPLDKVVVVGASLAGLRAVEALRRDGYEGRLTLVGAEPHAPYDRPPLSKRMLAGDDGADAPYLREPEQGFAEIDVDLRLGTRATGLDLGRREVVLDGDERLPYDGLIVATGATPRRLPGVPALDGIHVLRTLENCLAIRAGLDAGGRVAVIGGGFIGAEVAATARARGLDVTVIEALPVPLIRGLGPEMGGACAGLHADHGVSVRGGVTVERFEGAGRVERLRLSDGTSLDVDVVVIGVGVAPETGWLESSGLELSDGVVCDATCAASAPGVYAAGDVARWHNQLFDETMRVEHWTNAAEQGIAAARALLAGPAGARPFAPVPFFWSDQYDVKIQFVGRARADADVRVVHGSVEERRFVALYGREGRLVGALALNWPRLLMQYRGLLAGQASWDEALSHAAAAA